MALRPLDLSGIFSRAATIYAGHFPAFVAMVATAILPAGVLQYFITSSVRPQLDATIAWMQKPPNEQMQHVPPVLGSPQAVLFVLASLFFGYAILAFAVAAVGGGVAAANRTDKVSYGACMATALHRWRSIVAVVVLLIALAIAAAGGVTAAIVVPLAAFAAIAPAATVWLMAVGFLALLVALCVLLTMSIVVAAAAIYATTLENVSPSDAVSRALRRICNRREAGRALVCASAVSVVVIAATSCADLVGFAFLQRQTAAYLALDLVIRALVVPFAAIAFAVYYFDLRVRQEGYDIATRVAALNEAGNAEPYCAGEPAYAPTRYLSGEERALVAAFLARRTTLDAACRRDLAAQIVAPVRTRVPEELAGMDDEALLERL